MLLTFITLYIVNIMNVLLHVIIVNLYVCYVRSTYIIWNVFVYEHAFYYLMGRVVMMMMVTILGLISPQV